jgi:protein TonB
MTAIAKLLGSVTGQGYVASLVLHGGILTVLWGASGWLIAPVLLNSTYGGRRQDAIALSLELSGTVSVDAVPPDDPVVISPDHARMGDRHFVYAPATAEAPEVPSQDPAAVEPVLPQRPTDRADEESKLETPVERPRAASRRSPALPAIAAAALPEAPFRFVGRPPRYPAEALVRGWEGTVVLLVHLDGEGRVVKVEIETTSGFAAADAEAVRTVQTWRAVAVYPGESLTARIVRKPVQFTLRDIGQ